MAHPAKIQLTPHMQWIGEDLVRVRVERSVFSRGNRLYSPSILGADVGGSDPTGERACCALALRAMIAEDRRDLRSYRASESCGTKFGRSTSTTRIPAAARLAPDARRFRRRSACRWPPRVRADQARRLRPGSSRGFANGETFTDCARANSNYGACFPTARDD